MCEHICMCVCVCMLWCVEIRCSLDGQWSTWNFLSLLAGIGITSVCLVAFNVGAGTRTQVLMYVHTLYPVSVQLSSMQRRTLLSFTTQCFIHFEPSLLGKERFCLWPLDRWKRTPEHTLAQPYWFSVLRRYPCKWPLSVYYYWKFQYGAVSHLLDSKQRGMAASNNVLGSSSKESLGLASGVVVNYLDELA